MQNRVNLGSTYMYKQIQNMENTWQHSIAGSQIYYKALIQSVTIIQFKQILRKSYFCSVKRSSKPVPSSARHATDAGSYFYIFFSRLRCLKINNIGSPRKGARSRNLRLSDIWFNGATADGYRVQPIYKNVYIRWHIPSFNCNTSQS